MKITHINAKNLRQLSDVNTDLPPGLSLVVGANDAGKTTLLCIATRWALWGAHAVPSQDRQVTYGQSDMSVSVTFETGMSQYVVTRRLHLGSSGRSTVALNVESTLDGDITGATIRETQAALNELIGTYETFRMTAYVDQVEGPGDFLRRTPADQREVLREILDLGDWDAWHARAQEKSAESETYLNVNEDRLAAMTEDVSHNLPRALEQQKVASQTAADIGKLIQPIDSKLLELRADASTIHERHKRRLDLEQEHKSVLNSINIQKQRVYEANGQVQSGFELLSDAAQIESMYENHMSGERLMTEAREHVIKQNQLIASRNKQAQQVAVKCPTCKQPVVEMEDLLEVPVGLSDWLRKPDVIELKKRWANLQDAKANYDFHEQRFEEARKDLAGLQEQIHGVEDRLRQKDDGQEDAERLHKEIQKLEREQAQLRKQYQAAAQEQGRLGEVVNRLQTNEREAKDLSIDLAKRRDDHVSLELTTEVFSSSGVRQLMLDQAIRELEGAANGALAELMPGFSIHFSTQSATGVETLEQGVRTPGGLLAWQDLGGAASVAVALAVRIGLIELLSRYRGVKYEHMILDEADAWLVGERQEGYIRLLAKLGKTMNVTAISHIANVQEIVEQRIVLTPGVNGTEVDLR